MLSKKGKKKGQLTLFVILGLLLVATIGVFLYIYNYNMIDVKDDNPLNIAKELDTYVTSCINDAYKGSIKDYNDNGIILGEKEFFYYNGISYPVFSSGKEKGKDVNLMVTKKDFEDKLNSDMKEKFRDCTFISFSNRGFNIDKGEPVFTTRISYDKIYIDLDFDIEISYRNVSIKREIFSSEIKSSLGEVYDISAFIVNEELSKGFFDQLEFMKVYSSENEGRNIIITKERPYPNIIYTIEDKDFRTLYRFMLKENPAKSISFYDDKGLIGQFYSDDNLGCCNVATYKNCYEKTNDFSCSENQGTFVDGEDCSCVYENKLFNEYSDKIFSSDVKDFLGKNESNIQKFKDCKWINHGESRCIYEGEGYSYNSIVGSRHYREYCFDGNMFIEQCRDYREEFCEEMVIFDKIENNSRNIASCVPNRWESCETCKDEYCCYDIDSRDCIWIDDISKNNKGYCKPLVTPGIKFWEEGNEICSSSNENLESSYNNLYDKSGLDKYSRQIAFQSNLCSITSDCGNSKNIIGLKNSNSFSVISVISRNTTIYGSLNINTDGEIYGTRIFGDEHIIEERISSEDFKKRFVSNQIDSDKEILSDDIISLIIKHLYDYFKAIENNGIIDEYSSYRNNTISLNKDKTSNIATLCYPWRPDFKKSEIAEIEKKINSEINLDSNNINKDNKNSEKEEKQDPLFFLNRREKESVEDIAKENILVKKDVCSICDDFLSCSEYKCRSLDSSCNYYFVKDKFVCKKTDNSKTDKNMNININLFVDGSPKKLETKKIDVFDDSILGYRNDEGILEFSKIRIDVTTSQDSKCVVSYLPIIMNGNDDASWFYIDDKNNAFSKEHNMTFTVPPPLRITKSTRDAIEKNIKENLDSKDISEDDKKKISKLSSSMLDSLKNNEYNLFINCFDEKNHYNPKGTFINMNIKKRDDDNHKVFDFSPENDSIVSKNIEKVDFNFRSTSALSCNVKEKGSEGIGNESFKLECDDELRDYSSGFRCSGKINFPLEYDEIEYDVSCKKKKGTTFNKELLIDNISLEIDEKSGDYKLFLFNYTMDIKEAILVNKSSNKATEDLDNPVVEDKPIEEQTSTEEPTEAEKLKDENGSNETLDINKQLDEKYVVEIQNVTLLYYSIYDSCDISIDNVGLASFDAKGNINKDNIIKSKGNIVLENGLFYSYLIRLKKLDKKDSGNLDSDNNSGFYNGINLTFNCYNNGDVKENSDKIKNNVDDMLGANDYIYFSYLLKRSMSLEIVDISPKDIATEEDSIILNLTNSSDIRCSIRKSDSLASIRMTKKSDNEFSVKINDFLKRVNQSDGELLSFYVECNDRYGNVIGEESSLLIER